MCFNGKPELSPDSPPGAKAGIKFRLPINEQPPTINDEKTLPIKLIKMLEKACLTHTVLQEAADVHGSCNAAATASEVPGIL